jgi:benzoyl-CoA reductase/2-hydroxyglutaryl-CoA dehydratase subunit BcrC/BadD/HgdB
VYGETTCDAKKKTWELLDREVPTYVMEIPQMKRERDRTLWLEEVKDFKKKMEDVTKKPITVEALQKATNLMQG